MALALLGAACGSGDADLDTTAAAGGEAGSEAADADAGDSAAAEPTPADSSASDADTTSDATDDSTESDTSVDESEEPPAPTSHLFPDLDTTDIASGATVNLADQLAGGRTPVLLWFWAPH